MERIITLGETKDENGNLYNKKIINFQRKLGKIKNLAEYKYCIVIIANLNDSQRKHIVTVFSKRNLKRI